MTMEIIQGISSRAFWFVCGGVIFSEDAGTLVPLACGIAAVIVVGYIYQGDNE